MERPKRNNTIEKDYRERKRNKKDDIEKSTTPPILTATIKEDPQILFEQLYLDVVNYRDPEEPDYDITAIFLKLPSKKDYPDYYQIIKQPIALETIKTKVDKRAYQHISQMKADLDLMISNAKKYNMKGSQIYDDALKIQKFFKGWQGVKEKAVLKLPGDAFSQVGKIKTIRLKAIDKPKKVSADIKPLINAIIKRDTKKAIELLESDSSLDLNELASVEMFNDRFTWSPLHAACYNGDLKVIEMLLAKGADLELHDTWHSATPLGWAAFGEKEKIVKVLIQKYNANKKAKNVHGQVPFDLVSDQEDPKWIGLFKDSVLSTPSPPTIAPVPLSIPPQSKPTSIATSVSVSAPSLVPTSISASTRILQPPTSQLQRPPIPHAAPAPLPIQAYPTVRAPVYETAADGSIRKRRGRPPKSETDALTVRPTVEIDISTFDPVAFEIELFNALRTHTDNSNRLYSELFEDLPDRQEYPEYYKTIKDPRSLSEVAEKMQSRSYHNLYTWMDDMKLVFENAMSFNEPGSRIFRDAKLLLRLLHRLKERILARLGVPVSQEDDVMRLDLANRHFDVDALSEDKRRIKRFLSVNKSRTQSIEPDHHNNPYQQPIVHPLMLQQQQQQQQQQPSFLQPSFLMPPPQPSVNFSPSILSMNPGLIIPPPPNMVENIVESPKLPLNQASQEFYAAFDSGDSYLEELRVFGEGFEQKFDGEYLGHSLVVPSKNKAFTLQAELSKPLKNENNRLTVTVFQNNLKLNPMTKNYEWKVAPLNKGVNVFKMHVTANVSRPGSSPEYKSQVYHLFITQAW